MDSFQEALDALVRQIVHIVHPLRIVLFGSAARGEQRPGDIDLLVIMPNGTHRRGTAQKLYREVSGIGVPFDIVVATPEDIAKHKDNLGLVYRSALKDGKDIYAA